MSIILKHLISLIIKWAVERGLDKNGTVDGQLIKTAEELAELIIAISKDNIADIKDSIGDVFVTLIIGCMLAGGVDIEDAYYQAKSTSTMKPKRKLDYIYFLNGSLHSVLHSETYIWRDMVYIIECLVDVCVFYELDFIDCVDGAYKEISSRKGRVIDGTFVKESDLG